MNFVFGRENLALTIFVPFDCNNNCTFCTSKQTYKTSPPSIHRVKASIRTFFRNYSFPIKDVVFTGGEPMVDVHILSELISLIPSEYNVYINTTFINKNLSDFVSLVNGCYKIKGVNISRHSETYNADREMFCDIADDESINLIKKPVRINCVVGEQDIERVVKRWTARNVELCFREDYTTNQDDGNHLHNPYGNVPLKLLEMGYCFHSHVQCNVCDTTRFVKDDSVVSFHKGKHHSSILRKNHLEINDLIIDQSGGFAYDWCPPSFEIAYELLGKFAKRSYNGDAYMCETPCGSGCGGSSIRSYHGCGISDISGCGISDISGCGGSGIRSYHGCGISDISGCGGSGC